MRQEDEYATYVNWCLDHHLDPEDRDSIEAYNDEFGSGIFNPDDDPDPDRWHEERGIRRSEFQ